MHDGMSPDPGFGLAPGEAREVTARAGEPLEPGLVVASREAVIEALKTVYDPEIPVDIYELGLIYGLEIADTGAVSIRMSLTAPACPVAGELPQWVANAVEQVAGTGEVEVQLVWDPPWDQSMMTEDARMALGIF